VKRDFDASGKSEVSTGPSHLASMNALLLTPTSKLYIVWIWQR